jgi:hypothetical protein
MKTINLKAERGKQTISREDGLVIAQKLTEAMEKEDKITVDFNNILIASVSFFDEAFGKLAFKYSKDILVQKLSFENMEPFDRALLNDILISRYHEKDIKAKQEQRKKGIKSNCTIGS